MTKTTKRIGMSDKLLLKFRAKSTPYGVTRETLKALAAELGTTETMVIHLAISRFAKEVLPAYEADDGALSPSYFAWLKETAQSRLPKSKVVSKKSLV
jgi:hypothetical protein